jgi:hypothetical protein
MKDELTQEEIKRFHNPIIDLIQEKSEQLVAETIHTPILIEGSPIKQIDHPTESIPKVFDGVIKES